MTGEEPPTIEELYETIYDEFHIKEIMEIHSEQTSKEIPDRVRTLINNHEELFNEEVEPVTGYECEIQVEKQAKEPFISSPYATTHENQNEIIYEQVKGYNLLL